MGNGKMTACDEQADLEGRTGKIYVLHWSGESKPWREWWNRKSGKPQSGLSASQKNSVMLWWEYRGKANRFLSDGGSVYPRIRVATSRRGPEHVFSLQEDH